MGDSDSERKQSAARKEKINKIALSSLSLDIFHQINVMRIIDNLTNKIANRWFEISSQKTEIKVFKKRDRQGNKYWLAFNPIDSSYNYFASEVEVRMWIEQNYYNY